MNFNSGSSAQGQAKSAALRAVVIRADGTREDLGVVSYWHRNPLKRWAWATKQFFKRVFKRMGSK